MHRKIVVLGFVSMLVLSTTLAMLILASSRTIYVDAANVNDPLEDGSYEHPFDKIQEGINNASTGDTILVRPGTYDESVRMNKTELHLMGVNRDTTIIDGQGAAAVVSVDAAECTISQFTMRYGTCGIYLTSTSYRNTITNDLITSNGRGVFIDRSQTNTLSHNELSGNSKNFGIEGLALLDFVQYIDESNTVDGKPIYYLLNQKDTTVPANAGYIALVNCTCITARDATLTKNFQGMLIAYTNQSTIENMIVKYNTYGVQLWCSHNSTIYGNTMLYNNWGIDMDNSTGTNFTDNYIYGSTIGVDMSYCSNNTISGNTIENVASSGRGIQLSESHNNTFSSNAVKNCYSGIFFGSSGNNTFYHNNLINNYFSGLTSVFVYSNAWDNGWEGNYWSDYADVDANGDGVGDSPYEKMGILNIDHCPLIAQWNPIIELNVTGCKIPGYAESWITTSNDHVVASLKFIYTEKERIGDLNLSIGIITFNITAGASGFCSVTIPIDRLAMPFEFYIDDKKISEANYSIPTYNATHWTLYFNYDLGTHRIRIKSYRLGMPFGDVDCNGKIDMMDIGYLCIYFGRKWS